MEKKLGSFTTTKKLGMRPGAHFRLFESTHHNEAIASSANLKRASLATSENLT